MFAKIKQDQVIKFPYDYSDLQADNPFTNFKRLDLFSAFLGTEENLNGASLVPVNVAEIPAYDQRTQKVVCADTPQKQNGEWVLAYSVVSASPEEIKKTDEEKANLVRNERNKKLADSDWTQVLDAPVDRTAWAVYREALRRLPEQEGFPYNVVWPNKPE